jgi:predicted NBD/HSP70 family sugar kinase
MAYFAGLDVSVKETSVCIVDDAGKIMREARVASEPDAEKRARRAAGSGCCRSWASRRRRKATASPSITGKAPGGG